jgi:DNA-binding PadR family transcriptional regulator
MARERTTRYVLLGAIHSIGTASGYEARKYITDSVGYFWNESFGQIYPELAAMQRDGLITAVDEAGVSGRGRTRYRITPRGRAMLKSWLEKPARQQPVRQEALLKVFFGHVTGSKAVRRHLEREEAGLRAREARFAELAESVPADYASDADLAYGLAVLRAGQLLTATRLQWIADTRTLMDAADRGTKAVLTTWRRLHGRS